MDKVWSGDVKLAKPTYKPTAGIFTFQMGKKRKHVKNDRVLGFLKPPHRIYAPFIHLHPRPLALLADFAN